MTGLCMRVSALVMTLCTIVHLCGLSQTRSRALDMPYGCASPVIQGSVREVKRAR